MDPSLRILDANLNRAREGLRTAEEYARLALEDGHSTELLKGARHLLQELLESDPPLAARLLQARNVEGDIGARPEGDACRPGLADVARAGIKRAQEALRVVEETAQAVASHLAPRAARARYLAYMAEQQLFSAAPLRRLLRESPVMVIFTRAQCRAPWRDTLAALTGAGAALFQLREKDAAAADFLAFAAEARHLAPGAAFLVNDRADIARAVEAAGVHVGQQDLPVHAARDVVGPGRLVGASTHGLDEALAAARAGADYIGLGAMFPTGSKKIESYATPDVVREVLQTVRMPVFCIGGVTPENAAGLRELGVKQVAAGAAILGATDPAAAFRALCEKLGRP